MNISVERAGFFTTVQDRGRFGHRDSGVSVGGALDSHALTIANLLVGNATSAAGIEATLGTLRLRFDDDRVVAWCGGEFDADIKGAPIPAGRVAIARRNETVTLRAPASGARAWLAISGGIDVPLILGSRSTDVRSGFGGMEGRALRDGNVLQLGEQSEVNRKIQHTLARSGIANWLAPNEWSNTRSSHGVLRIVRGAEWSEFAPATRAALSRETFVVTPDSDRMGLRLEGPALLRETEGDLLSEAVAPGTIQVPPGGQPILLLGDCQTIGGYPKIAHVITVDLAAAAQLRPGDPVRFAEVSLLEAQEILKQRELDVEWFRAGLALRTA